MTIYNIVDFKPEVFDPAKAELTAQSLRQGAMGNQADAMKLEEAKRSRDQQARMRAAMQGVDPTTPEGEAKLSAFYQAEGAVPELYKMRDMRQKQELYPLEKREKELSISGKEQQYKQEADLFQSKKKSQELSNEQRMVDMTRRKAGAIYETLSASTDEGYPQALQMLKSSGFDVSGFPATKAEAAPVIASMGGMSIGLRGMLEIDALEAEKANKKAVQKSAYETLRVLYGEKSERYQSMESDRDYKSELAQAMKFIAEGRMDKAQELAGRRIEIAEKQLGISRDREERLASQRGSAKKDLAAEKYVKSMLEKLAVDPTSPSAVVDPNAVNAMMMLYERIKSQAPELAANGPKVVDIISTIHKSTKAKGPSFTNTQYQTVANQLLDNLLKRMSADGKPKPVVPDATKSAFASVADVGPEMPATQPAMAAQQESMTPAQPTSPPAQQPSQMTESLPPAPELATPPMLSSTPMPSQSAAARPPQTQAMPEVAAPQIPAQQRQIPQQPQIPQAVQPQPMAEQSAFGMPAMPQPSMPAQGSQPATGIPQDPSQQIEFNQPDPGITPEMKSAGTDTPRLRMEAKNAGMTPIEYLVRKHVDSRQPAAKLTDVVQGIPPELIKAGVVTPRILIEASRAKMPVLQYILKTYGAQATKPTTM